jgi:plasmid maintenance system antidote protein VapI
LSETEKETFETLFEIEKTCLSCQNVFSPAMRNNIRDLFCSSICRKNYLLAIKKSAIPNEPKIIEMPRAGIHPGIILKQELEKKNIKEIPQKLISVVNGTSPITNKKAHFIATVLNIGSKQKWLLLQKKYDIISDNPICPYCNNMAIFYKNWKSLGSKWVCDPCNAWVGVHKNTSKSLGMLANSELRKLRNDAHKAFDALWRAKMIREACSEKFARKEGYKWLSIKMNIRFEDCHIAMMNIEQCNQVIELCQPYLKVVEYTGKKII